MMYEKYNVLVLGASPNPERYANKAVCALKQLGVNVYAVGHKTGVVCDVNILNQISSNIHFHTITLYLSPENQAEYYSQILDLNPERVIFNPGTENDFFVQKLIEQGIQAEIACTLVLINTNQFLNQNNMNL